MKHLSVFILALLLIFAGCRRQVAVLPRLVELDSLIAKYSKGWKLNRIPKVNLAILRIAVYEIIFENDTPDSVAINEAVELAKKYSGSDDSAFINGILGAVVREK